MSSWYTVSFWTRTVILESLGLKLAATEICACNTWRQLTHTQPCCYVVCPADVTGRMATHAWWEPSAALSCHALDGGVPLSSGDVNFYFCVHHDVQTGTEAHLASHSMESRIFILGVKRSELEADNRSVGFRMESCITLYTSFLHIDEISATCIVTDGCLTTFSVA